MKDKSIQELLERFADGDVSVHCYSGRGMYGKECVSLHGSMRDCMAVIAEVIKEAGDYAIDMARDDEEGDEMWKAREAFETITDKLLKFSTDSMGLDVVVYWPRIEWVEEEETEE